MKELTVNQFSKQTGIPRSKIYYQIKINKLKINNGKINFENAHQLFISKALEKNNDTHEINIKQILNILTLQNLNLQRQLDLAYEREKFYLAELAIYRQNLPPNTTLYSPIVESNIQADLENNGVDTDENSQKQMQSESENQAPLESCQSINKETKSVNKTESDPYSTESNYNEMTEQNDNALLDKTLPNQDDIEPSLNLNRPKKNKAPLAKISIPAKPIRYMPPPNRTKSASPTTQSMTDQDDINKEDFHNSE
ncbi:hypothetical protein IIQ44_18375 [Acinetobacter oleivorans]|nr:hypothetical protein [Acinetobacter oleivorans]MCU4424416.1 hypothetical protein [Acinetobacter sp. WU_MDCI_Abxb74]